MDAKSEDAANAAATEQVVNGEPLAKDTSAPSDLNVAPASQSLQTTAQQLTNQTLHFLSTASNETLGACLVGLGGTTYLVLGRVGLVLMGVVGGVVLHATWEGSVHESDKSAEERRKREVGLEVVHRVLDWRTRRINAADGGEEEGTSKVEVYSKKRLDFTGFQPDTRAALTELTDAIIRDYVKWWYSPILPTELAFPAASQQTLTAFLLSISTHLSRKRPADTFLDFLTNSSSIVIVFLNELSSAIAASPSSSCAEAIHTYLELKPDSNLANVLDTKHQQKKLDLVAQDVLESYLEQRSLSCEPVRVFCQQIISQVIMEMTITSCSKPEFINGWIVYLLEDGEPELLKDIDAGLDGIAPVPPRAPEASEIIETGAEKDSAATKTQHKRTLSRAQEAMDDALREAQRLSQLIAEDDARRLREMQTDGSAQDTQTSLDLTSSEEPSIPTVGKATPPASTVLADDASESTTQGVATPTSSQSDAHGEDENRSSQEEASSIDQSQLDGAHSAGEDAPAPFTSFDQLVLPNPTALSGDYSTAKKAIPPLTLHNAGIVIFDDTDPNDRSSLRSKPQVDYLIQIEPAEKHYPGWMIVRKYADFETIHEILRRIAAVSGAGSFVQAHTTLPNFKVHTKSSLREALERYISDAVHHKSLAESEGMKRFLEKDRGLDKSPSSKGGFGWPTPTAFDNMGKGMMDVLTKAPKEGGKAFIGGVSGVLGAKKKQSISGPASSRNSISSPPGPSRIQSGFSSTSQTSLSRKSQDSLRNMSPIVDTQPALVAQMERKSEVEADTKTQPSSSTNSRATSVRESMEQISALGGDQIIQLPPPPSDIPDDYNPLASASTTTSPERTRPRAVEPETPVRTSTSTTSSSLDVAKSVQQDKPTSTSSHHKPKPSITEQETQVAVELLFATIQELYTLSSAWTLRRTLLTAAKTFLLRPGNPQLESIRQLLQTTVLDANTSDAGIATHLRKLRANALPTEEELKAWPAPLTEKENEDLRVKARKLLVERGMPQALTSVMGQAASGEALGKVFDCLQVQSVARGLIFGLVLQGMRAVTQ